MTDALITVKITGLDNVQARLAKLGTKLMDFTEAFETLASSLVMFYSQTVFISEGQALGTPWAPLKPKTEAYKNKNWPGRGELVRSGFMQQNFTHAVTPNSLFISNDAPYFPYQQMGTSEGPGRGHNIPARPMLGINETVEGMVKETIAADVRAKIDSAEL